MYFRSKNPPPARSGHRMVNYKRLLIVFGGFHDNAVGDYRYYNDVHSFNLDTYEWTKLDVAGNPPLQRSGFIIIYICSIVNRFVFSYRDAKKIFIVSTKMLTLI